MKAIPACHPASAAPRRRFILGLLATGALLAGCATHAPHAERAALAPTGTLRVAVYPGSPTSLVEAAAPESMRGVTVDIGRALARTMGVPSEVVVYPRVAEVVAALQRGEADFTITNASQERAKLVDFARPLVDLELGVLARPGSRIGNVEAMDQAGATIGVSQGSSSERVLGARLKQTRIRTFPNLDAARNALLAGEIDAFATNKGILFEMAERAPGTRVLDGRWGAEHLAPAIPKGRSAGKPYLESFIRDVQANGELEAATKRAGLRGTLAPSP
ncbi:amino acid ABC transporter substrate-binding protein, PAAT family [Noviherbaspirillum humi]|uniref:Amino acid ABC transporter substrate-binding protein, PAAT family n=1 Tax=Noviherbaspirillum humi TaxID=1688639 RepID=A0A239F498_9BURK|nr:transporter substrate-binding domain-containing protein [Noviherbaspirillum humi]SNS51541.1 amino acid ABC transporter substrate-binding protein, PAAT family [Noviherbaspirillum humi]